jgi:hypothetical protein
VTLPRQGHSKNTTPHEGGLDQFSLTAPDIITKRLPEQVKVRLKVFHEAG